MTVPKIAQAWLRVAQEPVELCRWKETMSDVGANDDPQPVATIY